MDDADRRLLNALQAEIPIVERPFAELGAALGLDEADVLRRARAMDAAGRFRRVGPSFNPRGLGHTSTLAAARVPKDKVDETVAFINRFAEITHNYERDDEFNVWFTIIAESKAAVGGILDKIRDHTAAAEVVDLPATHIFKTRVHFDV
ncbi:MAG: AsnC family transcriptional regulator [Planctomycetota bacterium]